MLVVLAALCACKAGTGTGSSGGGAGSGSSGHGGSSGGGRGSTPPLDAGTYRPPTADAAIEELAECRVGATDAEIGASVVIADEYAESLHELIGCGGLSFALCSAVIDGVIDAIIQQSDDATPDGWEFAGDGVYRTSSAGTVMDMTFYVTEDFSFAKAGQPVTHDLFLVDSYLVGAKLSIDFRSGDAEIDFDAPGPLVELLGFGAHPDNPLPVDLNDLFSIKRKLRLLELEGQVVVQDTREHSTIGYTLNVPRMSASKFVSGAVTMQYDLKDVEGDRADLGQTLSTSLFDVAYANHGTLTGIVDFHVAGGPVEYDGHFAWNDTPYPTRTLSCASGTVAPDEDGGM
jgi:hypothetical protein